jgi:hypothetical protein
LNLLSHFLAAPKVHPSAFSSLLAGWWEMTDILPTDGHGFGPGEQAALYPDDQWLSHFIPDSLHTPILTLKTQLDFSILRSKLGQKISPPLNPASLRIFACGSWQWLHQPPHITSETPAGLSAKQVGLS